MKATEIILELMKYVLPAAAVLAAVVYMLREQRQREELKQRYAVFQGALNQIVPLRLQAYERLLLFMERINFENLLARVDLRGKTAKALQLELTAEIRVEFEHNLTQQLYIDRETWEAVVKAKEHTIGFIHKTASVLTPEASGSDFGKLLLREMVKTETVPTYDAIGLLRRDVQKMFRFGAND